MSQSDAQQFLRDLDKKLWSAADRLRANLDAAVYSRAERTGASAEIVPWAEEGGTNSLPKPARRVDAEASSNHAVLGLIFLSRVERDRFAAGEPAGRAPAVRVKYVSDSFAIRQREIEAQLRDPASDYYLNPSDLGSEADYAEAIRAELEERDYYLEKNVFWVPALARWKTLQDSAKLPPGTEITAGNPPSKIGKLEGLAGRQIEITNGRKTTYKITSIGKLIDDAQ